MLRLNESGLHGPEKQNQCDVKKSYDGEVDSCQADDGSGISSSSDKSVSPKLVFRANLGNVMNEFAHVGFAVSSYNN